MSFLKLFMVLVIKEAILNEAGEFQGKDGKNSDIKVINGKIQSQGTRSFKGKEFQTDLNASDFFGDLD